MNWEMLGHEWAVDQLSEHIDRNRVRHAYLITGPLGVGRRTLAVRMAQALNCQNPPAPGQVCGTCRAGIQMALLLRFEEAHNSASNALLKTLEEPSPQVILMLTAESPESLLPTVVSRCEVLRLRPLPLEQVISGLQTRQGLQPEQARLLAHVSGGRPGYAIRLQAEPERLEQRQIWLDEQVRLLGEGRAARFAFAELITKEKDKDKNQLRDLLITWLSYWRDVMLRTSGASAPVINLDRADEIDRIARKLALRVACAAVAALERTLGMLDKNVNNRLAAEVLMLDLPSIGL